MGKQVHKVRTFRWEIGTLKSFDYFFDTTSQALGFGKDSSAPLVKVYHYDGSLLECFVNSDDPRLSEMQYT